MSFERFVIEGSIGWSLASFNCFNDVLRYTLERDCGFIVNCGDDTERFERYSSYLYIRDNLFSFVLKGNMELTLSSRLLAFVNLFNCMGNLVVVVVVACEICRNDNALCDSLLLMLSVYLRDLVGKLGRVNTEVFIAALSVLPVSSTDEPSVNHQLGNFE